MRMRKARNLRKIIGKNIKFVDCRFTATGRIIYLDKSDDTFLVHIKNVISGIDYSWNKSMLKVNTVIKEVVEEYSTEDRFYFIIPDEITVFFGEDFTMDTE